MWRDMVFLDLWRLEYLGDSSMSSDLGCCSVLPEPCRRDLAVEFLPALGARLKAAVRIEGRV